MGNDLGCPRESETGHSRREGSPKFPVSFFTTNVHVLLGFHFDNEVSSDTPVT